MVHVFRLALELPAAEAGKLAGRAPPHHDGERSLTG
jgi:hypothetical protein